MAGHRGRRGELTVRVPAGDASIWTGVERFWIGRDDPGRRLYEVEHSRAYRDRLVLKLRGIDDGNAAAQLRGATVSADRKDAVQLPRGVYWRAELVGLDAYDEQGERLGRITDVIPTGGHDVLEIDTDGGGELLVPWTVETVTEVDLDSGSLRLRVPDGLRDLS